MEKLRVKYLNDKCVIEQHGDWIDLKASQDYVYKAGDLLVINLGVCIELPEGYEAYLLPRSSTFKKYWLLMANNMGVIDEAYCGDNDWWQMQCVAFRDGRIDAGTRIAQFRIMKKQPAISVEVVSTLGNYNRGGIGSTGN